MDERISAQWPQLRWDHWQPTADGLHLRTQVVGKTMLGLTPLQNHWWNVALTVSVLGLTTGPMPLPDGRLLEVEFDFLAHTLELRLSTGSTCSLPLRAESIADFFAGYCQALRDLRASVTIHPLPCELANPIRFDRDLALRPYDAQAVGRFHRVLLACDTVFRLLHGLPGQVQPGALLAFETAGWRG